MLQKRAFPFSIDSVISLVKKEFKCISPTDCISRCDHVMQIEKDYVRSDQRVYNVTVCFKINKEQDCISEDVLSDNNSEGNFSWMEELS